MAQAAISATPSKVGQAARRRYQKFKDPHGRVWGAVVDFKAEVLDACGPFEPQGWTAPVMPDQQYLRIDLEDVGRLVIDYDRWLRDLTDAGTRWATDLERYAFGMYTDTDERSRALAEPPQSLLRLCGPKPMHPNVVRACQRGHPWALGLSDERPAWADEYLPQPVQRDTGLDFMADDPFLAEVKAEVKAEAASVKRSKKGAAA